MMPYTEVQTAAEVMRPSFWEGRETVMMRGQGIPVPDFTPPLPTELPAGAVLFGTSGSSGVVKWVVHTRESLRASAEMVNRHLGVQSGDVMGLLLPVFHVGGFGVLARAQVAGVPWVEFGARWDALRAHAFLAEHGVTITSLVPTQVYDLVQAGLRAPATLRAIVVGGGALEQELGQRARELGWPVLASYGMSEAGSQIATAPLSSLAQPYVATDPLQLLPGWSVTQSADGLLRLRGAALCTGILYQEGARYAPHQELQSADRVELQGQTLRFLGRQDRLVKVKGELIDLAAYEVDLAKAAGHEVVLLAQPDERVGHRLHIVTETELSPQIISLTLPPYVEIAAITVVPRFPRSGLGKIDRRALQRTLS